MIPARVGMVVGRDIRYSRLPRCGTSEMRRCWDMGTLDVRGRGRFLAAPSRPPSAPCTPTRTPRRSTTSSDGRCAFAGEPGGSAASGHRDFLAVASRSSQSLSSCRSAGDRTPGASVSSARSATACTATRSAAGAASGPPFGVSAEAGTVMAVSIASRMVSESRGSRSSGGVAARVSVTPVPAAWIRSVA